MAEKVLNTRIQLKYDSFANWTSKNPILKMGEVAFATVETSDKTNTTNNNSNNEFQNLPNIVMKVGNGTDHYNDLKFVSALAADVYAWAKAATKPTYTANEIQSLKEFVDQVIGQHTEIQDSDTRYTVIRDDAHPYTFKLMATDPAKSDTTYDNLVATIDFTEINTRLTALEGLVGSETVSKQITDAIGSLDAPDSAVAGQFVTAVSETDGRVSVSRAALQVSDIPAIPQSKVTGLEDALKDLDDTKQDNLPIDGTPSDKNKVATQATVTSAINALDNAGQTVAQGEIISSVSQADGVIAVQKRALVKADIPTIDESQVAGLTARIDAKQDLLGFTGQYNKETNPVALKDYVDKVISDVNGAMHFRGQVPTDPTTWENPNPDNTYEAGDVVLFGVDEYVYDGAAWHVLGNESIYALKTDVDKDLAALDTKMQGQIDALDEKKQDKLSFEGEYNATNNKVTTKSYVDNAVSTAIGGLDQADAAVEKQFVTAVSEVDGIITVSRAALKATDIPNIEQSQVNGLVDKLASKQDKLTFDGTYDAASNPAATKKTVTDAIEALDKPDAAVAKQFVTSVSESNGIITVNRAQPTYEDISGLATIAHTGNVNDLIQTEGDILVFNCGTASTVM